MPATKQYTDNAISSVQSSITYPVTSVNNLTGAVSLDYTNVGAPSTSGANATGNNWNIGILGNSGSTTQLATARNIALTGDVTGNVNFNGTADVSITTTVADDSHNHVIANVDGLQAALNAKQDAASPATNSLALNGKADTDFVQTTNNTSLNSDSRNTRGVTRLYRRMLMMTTVFRPVGMGLDGYLQDITAILTTQVQKLIMQRTLVLPLTSM